MGSWDRGAHPRQKDMLADDDEIPLVSISELHLLFYKGNIFSHTYCASPTLHSTAPVSNNESKGRKGRNTHKKEVLLSCTESRPLQFQMIQFCTVSPHAHAQSLVRQPPTIRRGYANIANITIQHSMTIWAFGLLRRAHSPVVPRALITGGRS